MVLPRLLALGPVLGLLLSACAAPPPVASRPELPAGPAGRLARAALDEWEAWNRPTVEGWPESLPAGTEPPADHFERIMGYWAAVPEGSAVVSRHLALRDAMVRPPVELAAAREDGTGGGTGTDAGFTGMSAGAPLPPSLAIWAYPAWSAAFVSHVLRRGGVWESEVPASAAHATYVDALLSRAATDPDASFMPRDPAEHAPRPGDLICADRARAPLVHWQDRLAEAGRFRPMHCDIVVSARSGRVEAVGGNVLDSVALRRFPADAQGRVLPPPAGKPPFFVIFENRMR